MDIRDLKVFQMIAFEKSVSKAAKKIITAMQIRRIKIQKLPVSWNLQMI